MDNDKITSGGLKKKRKKSAAPYWTSIHTTTSVTGLTKGLTEYLFSVYLFHIEERNFLEAHQFIHSLFSSIYTSENDTGRSLSLSVQAHEADEAAAGLRHIDVELKAGRRQLRQSAASQPRVM